MTAQPTIISTTPSVTARQRLGQIIAWHIDRRGWDARRVANATSTSIDVVHDWRGGRTVPSSRQWMLLKGTVARDLSESSQLWHEAMLEYEESERIAKEEKRKIMANHHGAKNAPAVAKLVSMADKIQSVIATPLPPPPPEPSPSPDLVKATPEAAEDATDARRRAYRKRPKGALTLEAQVLRREWATAFFRNRPNAPVQGADSLSSEMRKIYGVGIDHDVAFEIKRRVREELGLKPGGGTRTDRAPIDIITTRSPTTTPETAKDTVKTSHSDVNTAAQLVLDTIPNLRTFTIVVGDDGRPKVSYTVRETRVVEESHTLEMKPR